MRILYFTRSNSVHDQRFLKALADSPYEGICLRLYPGDYPVPEGIRLVAWPGLKAELALTDLPTVVREFKCVLDQVKPDLVHAGPLHDVAYLAMLSGFHPLVAMSWGFDLMKDVDTKLTNMINTRLVFERATRLIVDAQCSADRAVTLGYPAEKICRFPWGIDLEYFSPEAAARAGQAWREQQGWLDKKVLLCLRSWEPNYGVDDLARAFIKAAHTNPDLRLILLNDGSQAKEIRQILHDGGILSKVYFGDKVANEDLLKYYGAADVYVSPSHVDGSSVSLMEALACGLPALVSDIPANKEWVWQDVNGWIYPDGNIKALAQRMLDAVETAFEPMKIVARNVALSKADWRKNVQMLYRCYKEVLNG
ncbi:MAG: glycosyltransferase family 4 protein [Chloroflexi bacterium]|nr:glycosyltransferase family 4 protein [Chloroflexota bacterium]